MLISYKGNKMEILLFSRFIFRLLINHFLSDANVVDAAFNNRSLTASLVASMTQSMREC